MKEVFLTPEGRQKLQEELDFLINVRRPEVAQRIKEAKEEGDVSENAGYDEAKTQQGFLEGRIQELEHVLKIAKVIDEPDSADRVQLGSTVTVSEGGDGDEETVKIVGSAEANPGQGLISNESPLGKSLLNRVAGDRVSVQTPGGVLQFKIVAIR
ncbi:MAG: transcription elongation factor GreA [Anaerolineae bacterium]|nr:transcription elongation factor GreA [Anaerolineae bacterium]